MQTSAQTAIQNLLRRKLLEFQRVNPLFSVRALARRLELHPSATNEILKGQRRVSFKMACKIADKLLLDPTERAQLLKDFPKKLKSNTENFDHKDHEVKYLKLGSMQFDLISNPIHFGILSLINTDNFKSDPAWIAKRLGSTVTKVEKALKNLLKLNLVKQDEKGEFSRTYEKVNTTDDVLNTSIQRSHMEDMEVAKKKLLELPVHLRDFYSYTLPADPDLLPQAKEIIRKAQLEIDNLMKTGPQKEVYKLCTYFYPVTEIKKGDTDEKNQKI